ncbi:DNA alkylation repair protein [Flavobacterium sp. NKUCC04_CG]|uniref:DNA alkylation repair protein n=1 Tax=Flavobacterium sp. NKUCC04_CG TaxID=2842121 RepID=UPI001C5B6F99|nr:DNA alkylation repair protein [Flavobacterium sp. NKUCC04_CG]MBW3518569.1 DNA alkylation repair protein [Flavobacterium sp. NKUCC04_CG]
MALIKDIYNEVFFKQLTAVLNEVIPDFKESLFIEKIYANQFLEKEWKDRMLHVTEVLHVFMPADFNRAAPLLMDLITVLQQQNNQEEKLAYIFLAEYISKYGIHDMKTAIPLLEHTTQFISCEFAVRPFILKYPEPMLLQLYLWSQHENYKVRRFASEGSRPKLPWSMALPLLQKDPTLSFKILENLIDDVHPWVRKSVANHLNDISKDNPEKALIFAKKWKNNSIESAAIIKHGMRTLLKQGQPDVLALYDLDAVGIEVSKFKINTPSVTIGTVLDFEFQIENHNLLDKIIRLEYAVYYQKANGQLNKKVFKISERSFKPLEKSMVKRKQSFKIITTRVFYTGLHQLTLIINGQESEKLDFQLI